MYVVHVQSVSLEILLLLHSLMQCPQNPFLPVWYNEIFDDVGLSIGLSDILLKSTSEDPSLSTLALVSSSCCAVNVIRWYWPLRHGRHRLHWWPHLHGAFSVSWCIYWLHFAPPQQLKKIQNRWVKSPFPFLIVTHTFLRIAKLCYVCCGPVWNYYVGGMRKLMQYRCCDKW